MSINSRSLFGLFLVVLGLSFFANNFGFADFDLVGSLFKLWPVLLILWGLDTFRNRHGSNEYVTAGILVILGLLFLGGNYGLIRFGWASFWRLFWPTILILMGWSLLNGKKSIGGGNSAIMGSVEKKGTWVVQSDSFFAFWGGVTLDLSSAVMEADEVTLELTAIMGGVEIYVPEHFTVNCRGSAVLGGVEFLGKSQGGVFSSFNEQRLGTGSKVINVNCQAIMGGIDFKKHK